MASSAASIGGVAGQWLKGQLQPPAQHPPESPVNLCFSVVALTDGVAIALAQSSLIPSIAIVAAAFAGCAGMAWACRGEDIVTKTNISAITMRVQSFAIVAI
jgi:hypothetical protein